MKKLFIILGIMLPGIVTNAIAQYTTISNAKVLHSSSSNTAKVIADSRAYERFHKSFPGIADDRWEKASNGHYTVRFSTKEADNWVYLDKKGNCYSQIRFYSEKGLPLDVRKQIRTTYYDYTIKNAKEVRCNSTIAYLVTIEDEKTWKVIRVVESEMDIWEEHVKG